MVVYSEFLNSCVIQLRSSITIMKKNTIDIYLKEKKYLRKNGESQGRFKGSKVGNSFKWYLRTSSSGKTSGVFFIVFPTAKNSCRDLKTTKKNISYIGDTINITQLLSKKACQLRCILFNNDQV